METDEQCRYFITICVSSRLLSSGSLVLLSPSNEDEGYFECTAVNEVGEERRVIEVILQGIDSDSQCSK